MVALRSFAQSFTQSVNGISMLTYEVYMNIFINGMAAMMTSTFMVHHVSSRDRPLFEPSCLHAFNKVASTFRVCFLITLVFRLMVYAKNLTWVSSIVMQEEEK